MKWLLLLLILAWGRPLHAEESRQPNIIVILMDDMGYGDIGPFGSKLNRTPELDRMAREGMKLTSFYAAPVCSATRASLMTGCYPPRVSIPGVLHPDSEIGLNPDEHTIAELLKSSGYRTTCIGKWHLGDQAPFLPRKHGFDHYFGIPYSNDMFQPSRESGTRVIPLMRDDAVVELMAEPDQSRLIRTYTEEAVRFIQENQQHPFFLYLPHSAVHFPIHPGPEFAGKSANGRLGDWVEESDWSVGQILKTLRDLKIESNTLVVFTSDNGPWLSKKPDAGTAAPLYGGKGSTWEGGVRVPTIAWWPTHVPPGTSSDAIAGVIDLLPTAVSLAGGKVPRDRPLDGVDLSAVLMANAKETSRDTQFYYLGNQLQAVRRGPWKLAITPQNLSMGVPAGGVNEPGERLYNLNQDIAERHNVAARNPAITSELRVAMESMGTSLCNGATRGPGVRPPGRVDHISPLYPTKSRRTRLPPLSAEGKKSSP